MIWYPYQWSMDWYSPACAASGRSPWQSGSVFCSWSLRWRIRTLTSRGLSFCWCKQIYSGRILCASASPRLSDYPSNWVPPVGRSWWWSRCGDLRVAWDWWRFLRCRGRPGFAWPFWRRCRMLARTLQLCLSRRRSSHCRCRQRSAHDGRWRGWAKWRWLQSLRPGKPRWTIEGRRSHLTWAQSTARRLSRDTRVYQPKYQDACPKARGPPSYCSVLPSFVSPPWAHSSPWGSFGAWIPPS